MVSTINTIKLNQRLLCNVSSSPRMAMSRKILQRHYKQSFPLAFSTLTRNISIPGDKSIGLVHNKYSFKCSPLLATNHESLQMSLPRRRVNEQSMFDNLQCISVAHRNYHTSVIVTQSDKELSTEEKQEKLKERAMDKAAEAVVASANADQVGEENITLEAKAEAPPATETTTASTAKDQSSNTSSSSTTNSDGGQTDKTYSSDPNISADIAKHKAGLGDPTLPHWQNPLHHNNPDMDKILMEDFDSPEEFEKAVQPLPPLDGSPPLHIQELAQEILQLNMLEMNELTNKLAQHFGFHEGMLSPDDVDGGDGDDDDEDEDGEAAPPVQEKTAFDLKLVAFDDKSKIKVIKEVRAIAGLGLKEAKELVEGAPKIITKDLKKETAEELKAKLEAVGATIEIV